MTFLADYIIRKHVPAGKNPELPAFRGNIGIAQGWISIITNLFLFIIIILAIIGCASLYSAAGGNFDPWAKKHILRFIIFFYRLYVLIYKKFSFAVL